VLGGVIIDGVDSYCDRGDVLLKCEMCCVHCTSSESKLLIGVSSIIDGLSTPKIDAGNNLRLQFQ